MRKFKNGDRVNLLSKSAGEVLSLDSMIEKGYRGEIDPPKSGVITDYRRGHDKWGNFYTVQIDDYNTRIHLFQQYCFKEHDLQREDEWGIDNDLFFI